MWLAVGAYRFLAHVAARDVRLTLEAEMSIAHVASDHVVCTRPVLRVTGRFALVARNRMILT